MRTVNEIFKFTEKERKMIKKVMKYWHSTKLEVDGVLYIIIPTPTRNFEKHK